MNSIVKKTSNVVKNPYRILAKMIRGRARFLSDKQYLDIMYRAVFNKRINWKNPVTYNEKLQWLKIYDRKPEYSVMVDKYEVKKYVASKIGEDYIIPTLGVWDKFDEIDFDKLPDQFVLKCTHDSGGLVIVTDKQKLNIEAARRKIEGCLKRNYYWKGREWPYKNVKPRIIAEKYLVDESNSELKDYKIYNFGGTPKFIEVDYDRFREHKRNIYSINWDYMDVVMQYPNDSSRSISKPEALEIMLKAAEDLSKGIPHLRTDFYSINDKIYFGEMTFFSSGGFMKFSPDVWDKILGDWIKLPQNASGGGIIYQCKNLFLYIHEDNRRYKTVYDGTLRDYKLFCFSGEPEYLFVASDRNTPGEEVKFDYFDKKFNRLPMRQSVHPTSEYEIKKPEVFDEMLDVARKLAVDLLQVRIDFYVVDRKIYFGEYTFFHHGGLVPFIPEKYDEIWGDLIKLPKVK